MNPTWQTDDGRVKLWLALLLARAHVCHVAILAAIVATFSYALRWVIPLGTAISTSQNRTLRVKSWVFHSRGQFKILNSVVRLIAVDMVNQIVGRERASDVLLHDNTVFAPAVIDAVNFGRQNNVAFTVDRGSTAKAAPPCLRGCFALQASTTKNARLQQRSTRDGLLISAFAAAQPFVVFVRPRMIVDHDKAAELATRQICNFVHAAI